MMYALRVMHYDRQNPMRNNNEYFPTVTMTFSQSFQSDQHAFFCPIVLSLSQIIKQVIENSFISCHRVTETRYATGNLWPSYLTR